MYVYVYIYIYICIRISYLCADPEEPVPQAEAREDPVQPHEVLVGWHYLSNATRLIRHRSCYVLFVVSRSTIICQIIRHF